MQITLDFDSAAQNAPTAWKNAIETAAAIIGAEIQNNMQVTLAVGYGEEDGTLLQGTEIGLGRPSVGITLSYGQLVTDLRNAENASDVGFLDSLPSADPSGGAGYFLSIAQEKALGLISPNTSEIDGYIGFSTANAIPWNYGTTPVAGEYSLVDSAMHEITHALGREMPANLLTQMDLTAYRGGTIDLNNSDARYMSLDGGAVDLVNYDSQSDPADFANGGPFDSFNAGQMQGAYVPFSGTDAAIMGALGYAVDVPWSQANGNFNIQDFTTGISAWSGGVALNPSSGFSSDIVTNISDVLGITATVPNTLIAVGPDSKGRDPAAAAISFAYGNGNNVGESWSPETFFTGGSGNDTFYYIEQSQSSWTTAINFHAGDDLVLWGISPRDFNFAWAGDSGAAPQYNGLTGVCSSATAPEAVFTLAGVSTAAAGNIKVAWESASNGTPYLLVQA